MLLLFFFFGLISGNGSGQLGPLPSALQYCAPPALPSLSPPLLLRLLSAIFLAGANRALYSYPLDQERKKEEEACLPSTFP